MSGRGLSGTHTNAHCTHIHLLFTLISSTDWVGWAGLYLDKSVCPDWHSASFSFHRMSDDLSEKIRNQSCLGQSELLLQNTCCHPQAILKLWFVKHLNISRLLQIFQPLPGVSNTFLWSILLVWVISVILRPEIFIENPMTPSRSANLNSLSGEKACESEYFKN